jgi:signal transduction histidine kinase/DNA-binding response OmpR family regulator
LVWSRIRLKSLLFRAPDAKLGRVLYDDPFVLEPVAVHQDFFWFAVLLGWSLLLVLWRWLPRRPLAWGWVPWTAFAVVLAAGAQFATFSPPFSWLVRRTAPAPPPVGYNYIEPIVPVELVGDLITGAALALAAGGWLWAALSHPASAGPTAGRLSRRRLRWLAWPLVAGLGWLHYYQPVVAMSLAGAVMLCTAPIFRRAPGADRLSRVGVVLAALIPLLSPVGLFAAIGDHVMRDGPPSVAGFISSVFQIVIAGCALRGLMRSAGSTSLVGALATGWREDTALIVTAGLWLLASVGFAVHAGAQMRSDVLDNHLRAIVQRASQVRIGVLIPFGRGDLHLEDVELPDEARWWGRARLPILATEAGRRVWGELDRLGRPPPFSRRQGFTFIIDGWLVTAPGNDPPPGSEVVALLRRATPKDIDDWNNARPVVETVIAPEIDEDINTRAPVTDERGQVLAWHDVVRVENTSTMPRRVRTVPLLASAMGLVVLSALFLQRRATRDRQTAEREAAIAEEANRLKTTFLAKVSHELRTPIQSLLGYSELLQRQVAGDARAEAWLNALRQHGELMTRLVNDLIDLSAVEAGTFRLRPRPLALAELARQTIESLRPRAEAKGLKLQVAIAADLPSWIEADGERLRQIILNLVGNAVKFTDEGSVTVELRRNRRAGGAELALMVQDTGPGIPPAEQHRLFNAFSRLEFTAHKDGSGLGLSLSAALCRAMGGDLTVTSDGASGSCFTATFVAEAIASPAATDAAPAVIGLGGRQVLVVDDNALVRELFVTSLTDVGARCDAAGTAAEAMAAVERSRPDVIVLDLALPDDDGTRLAPRLRRVIPGVRIVGVSAHAGPTEREQALAAGMNAFLAKPVALDELAAAVAGGATNGAVPVERPGLRQRLEEQFRAEAPAKREELAAAIAAGDWRRARATAHYLANSAAVVREPALLEACVTLARAAEVGDGAAVQAAWPECENRLEPWTKLHADTPR